jgi:hypothetical protein
VHHNIEKESPLLSAYFIKNINKEFGLKLTIPTTMQDKKGQASLF